MCCGYSIGISEKVAETAIPTVGNGGVCKLGQVFATKVSGEIAIPLVGFKR